MREVIAGSNHKGVQPFTFVSFQVLGRMADLLQNRQQIDVFNNYTAGTDVIKEMFDHQEKILEKRIAEEREPWDDVPKKHYS